jgi:hypothetical protein
MHRRSWCGVLDARDKEYVSKGDGGNNKVSCIHIVVMIMYKMSKSSRSHLCSNTKAICLNIVLANSIPLNCIHSICLSFLLLVEQTLCSINRLT